MRWRVNPVHRLVIHASGRYDLGNTRSSTADMLTLCLLCTLLLPRAGSAGGVDLARAKALADRAATEEREGRATQAMQLWRSAIALYRLAGDLPSEAGCLIQVAADERDRDLAAAVRDLESAVEAARAGTHAELEASARAMLAADLYALGRYQQSKDMAEAALPMVRGQGRRDDLLALLEILGQLDLRLGRSASAVEHLEEALRLHRELGARWDVTVLLGNLGTAYQRSGHLEAALPPLTEALRLAQAHGDPRTRGKLLQSLGNVYEDLLDDDRALQSFTQAEALFQAVHATSELWMTRTSLAQIRAHQGRYPEAIALCDEAIRGLRQLEGGERLAGALETGADLYREQGRIAEATTRNEEALAIRRRLGFSYWSLSQWAKRKVKNAVNYIGAFEQTLAAEAERHNVDGVICGHIHHAVMHDNFGIRYVNCGDWVESCTAVGEHADGRLEIITWTDEASAARRLVSPRAVALEETEIAA